MRTSSWPATLLYSALSCTPDTPADLFHRAGFEWELIRAALHNGLRGFWGGGTRYDIQWPISSGQGPRTTRLVPANLGSSGQNLAARAGAFQIAVLSIPCDRLPIGAFTWAVWPRGGIGTLPVAAGEAITGNWQELAL